MPPRVAKIFTSGGSQAVRIPLEFRLPGDEVYIRRDAVTGDIVLSAKPNSWDALLALHAEDDGCPDFMGPDDRSAIPADRDPFKGWSE